MTSDAQYAEHVEKTDEPMEICVIKNVVALEPPSVIITLDSGADVPVAAERFYNLGLPRGGRTVQMVEAQGQTVHSSGNRRLRLPVKVM